jgi:dihydropteroate synthase
VVRVHDVHETVAALKVWLAMRQNGNLEGSRTA